FRYQSTGIETRFTNLLDPDPRSRQVFSFHRPRTLEEWVAGARVAAAVGRGPAGFTTDPRPVYAIGSANLRRGLLHMPPVPEEGLWPVQVRAVRNLEKSLA